MDMKLRDTVDIRTLVIFWLGRPRIGLYWKYTHWTIKLVNYVSLIVTMIHQKRAKITGKSETVIYKTKTRKPQWTPERTKRNWDSIVMTEEPLGSNPHQSVGILNVECVHLAIMIVGNNEEQTRLPKKSKSDYCKDILKYIRKTSEPFYF